MTKERIAELRALVEKATRGPWMVQLKPRTIFPPPFPGQTIVEYEAVEDAAFIAAARTALPEALDRIELLDTVLDSTIDSLKRKEDVLERVWALAVSYEASSKVKIDEFERADEIRYSRDDLQKSCDEMASGIAAKLFAALKGT
jgi:hypothetical protein